MNIKDKLDYPNPIFYILDLLGLFIMTLHKLHLKFYNPYSMCYNFLLNSMSNKSHPQICSDHFDPHVCMNILDRFAYPNPMPYILCLLVRFDQLLHKLHPKHYNLYSKLHTIHHRSKKSRSHQLIYKFHLFSQI